MIRDGPLENVWGAGAGEVQKKYSRKGKLNGKKSCTPINRTKIFMLWPKKNPAAQKFPTLPITFLMVRPCLKQRDFTVLSDVFVAVAQHNPVLQFWNTVVTIRNNVATLCCAKNRCCESYPVTSPLAP